MPTVVGGFSETPLRDRLDWLGMGQGFGAPGDLAEGRG